MRSGPALDTGLTFGVGLALGLGAGIISCATLGDRTEFTPARLRQEVRRRVPDLARGDVVVPYEVSRQTVTDVRARLAGTEGDARIRALVALMQSPDGLALRYEWAQTAPADVTLARGGGNCLSLSSVLIGLARELGHSARYVEVLVEEPESRTDGGVAVYADHLAAAIHTSEGRLYVDYSGELPRARSVRVIGDLEALAYYYNNRGYEQLHDAARDEALVPWESIARDFEIATQIHPGVARAWNNLGVARVRQGDDDAALRAYLRAIGAQNDLTSAHVNLTMLYLRRGELDAASRHLEIAERQAPEHPQVRQLRESLEAPRDDPPNADGGGP